MFKIYRNAPSIALWKATHPWWRYFKPTGVTPESSHCNANYVLMAMGMVRIHVETLMKSVVKSAVKSAVKTA